MISKLGYVPKESRGDLANDSFDTETITAADRSKFRTRKRAKKASPISKIVVGAAALVLVAGLGFGVWMLAGGDAADDGTALTYDEMKKPCDALDTSAMDSVIKDSKVQENTNEFEKHVHSADQACQVSFGKPGKGGSIAVNSQVFGRDARAKSTYKDALEEAKLNAEEASSTGGGSQKISTVDGVGTKAFSILRKATEESITIDYQLSYYEDNAFIETRISVFNGSASQGEVAKYAKGIAENYMEKWSGA